VWHASLLGARVTSVITTFLRPLWSISEQRHNNMESTMYNVLKDTKNIVHDVTYASVLWQIITKSQSKCKDNLTDNIAFGGFPELVSLCTVIWWKKIDIPVRKSNIVLNQWKSNLKARSMQVNQETANYLNRVCSTHQEKYSNQLHWICLWWRSMQFQMYAYIYLLQA